MTDYFSSSKNILQNVLAFCEEKNVRLLYLTKFGSKLYGTNNEHSDDDYKGIFLPNIQSCVLNKIPEFPQFSTGNSSTKNNSEDVDVELYSFQRFMELANRGDVGAIDLLYSFTNSEAVIYKNEILDPLFENPSAYFDMVNTKAFLGYAIGQSIKYSLRGERYEVLEKIIQFLRTDKRNRENLFLRDIVNSLVENCGHSSLCMLHEISSAQEKKEMSLCVLGSEHNMNISYSVFEKRMNEKYSKYGKRTKACNENGNVDWKAVSHAVRCLVEIREILETGRLEFPLKNASMIKDVKYGRVLRNDVEEIMDNYIGIIDNLVQEKKKSYTFDVTPSKNLICNAYGF